MNDTPPSGLPASTRSRALGRAIQKLNALAWQGLFDALPSATRRDLQATWEPFDGGSLFCTASLPHLMLNRLVMAPASAIPRAVRAFDERQVPTYLLSFDAEDFPDATRIGKDLGLVPYHRAWDCLVRVEPAPPLPELREPSGVRLRHARLAEAGVVAEILANAFDLPSAAAPLFSVAVGRPGWSTWVAEADGVLVAAGLLFTHGDQAYLAGGATRPEHRRHGIQRAMVLARVHEALSAGAKLIGSETGVALPGQANPSHDNLRLAGLHPVHVLEHLCPEGTRWPGALHGAR
jgi:GNAT superfamily N-acetyltransferase